MSQSLTTEFLNRTDEAIGRSAIRKTTLRLIPLMTLGYGTAYMDRVNISFAALQMNRDLHFTSTAYGFGAGLFFLTYAAFELPSNLLLYRFGARRWLSRIMFTWGIISIGMLLVRTPGQFYLMRALLGAAEAGFFPGVVFYLMQWFPPDMRARTITRFYISLPLSSVVMGSLAGAILNLEGRFGLAGWQWLFLVEGIPAIVLSIVFFLALPDGPTQAQWLSPAEREWVTQLAKQHSPSRVHDGQSIAPALYDPRTWLLGLFMLCFTATGYTYMLYGPAILQESTHLDASRVGYIIAVFNLIGAVLMLLNAIHSDRTHDRYWHILPVCVVMALSFLICGFSSAPRFVLPGFALLILCNSAMQGPLWSLPSTFFVGRPAAAGIAAINTISILGGFVGPGIMGIAHNLTGGYQRGLTLMAIPMLLATSIMLCLRSMARSTAVSE